MFWGAEQNKKSDDEKPETYMRKFFRACLLALAGVVALWLAVQLLTQFWVWLLIATALGGLIWGAVWLIRRQRDRRW